MAATTRSELAAHLAQLGPVRLSGASAAKIVDFVIQDMARAMATKGGLSIRGLGTFKPVPTAERPARNPRTGEKVVCPPSWRVKFTPAQSLTEHTIRANS